MSGDAPIRGIVHLGLAVIGICTFIALMAAYFQAKKLVASERTGHRIDTAFRNSRTESQKLQPDDH